MVLFNDIYDKVYLVSLYKNYSYFSDEEKKYIIDHELKKYIASKINLVEYDQIHNLDIDNTSVIELVNILANCIPMENHFLTMSHFIYEILNIVRQIQNWPVTWFDDSSEYFIDNPTLEINDGIWVSLITHQGTDYVKTFALVYDKLMNSVLCNEELDEPMKLNKIINNKTHMPN